MSDVTGRAVQARDVHGGVHFHGADHPSGPVPRQLPGDVHGFVNRVGELEMLSTHLDDEEGDDRHDVTIHVIVGTAGVGKTALALHWAHRVRDRFPDGQLYVNLRGYDPGVPVAPEQVLDRFLRALGVPSDAVPPDLESRAALYRSLVADRQMLVLLDNAATVKQVRPLLPGSSSCLVLVTSRDRLSGLVVRNGAQRLTVDTLAMEEAVELLETVTAGYRPRDDARDIVELARLCVRLPLALRIAAERAASRPHMPLRDLIRDLQDESGLWDALAVDDDEEADAVRTVFAWSYRALPEESARLFRLLGLHPGPDFDIRAAAQLAGTTVRRTRQQLDILAGAHLLEQTGPDRFQFHDLLRSYAVDQVQHEESPQRRLDALERLMTWYLYTTYSAVSAMDSHLRHLPLPAVDIGEVPDFADNAEAVRWYETERRNLVAATRAAASAGLHGIAWRLPAVLKHVYAFHTPIEEWITTGRIGLEAAQHLGERSGEAELSESLGMAYVQSQRTDEGLAHHGRALALRREDGDEFGVAMSLNGIGLAHLRDRQLTEARAHFEQCLETVRGIGERRWEGIALGNLADTLLDLGQLDEALDLAGHALDIHRETGNRMSEFACLITVSTAYRKLGRVDEALPYAQCALEVAQELDNPVREAYVLLELGRLQLDSDLPEEALVSYHHAATLHRRIGATAREAEAFEGAGQAYRRLGRLKDAAGFHRRAVAGFRTCDDHWQLAVSLHHLASVLAESGEQNAARRHWREALSLASSFSDSQAAELRDRITHSSPDSTDQ